MIRGNPKFDSISIGELSVSFLGSTLTFEGKAAFVNSRTGGTHGWTKNTQWSPATIAKLKELRALMELDLAALHLDGDGELLTDATGVAPARFTPEGGGLGEHLGGDSVPSV